MANDQYQYDKPSQAGTRFNAGFCVQDLDGKIDDQALSISKLYVGGTDKFWSCNDAIGAKYYYSQVAGDCYPVILFLEQKGVPAGSILTTIYTSTFVSTSVVALGSSTEQTSVATISTTATSATWTTATSSSSFSPSCSSAVSKSTHYTTSVDALAVTRPVPISTKSASEPCVSQTPQKFRLKAVEKKEPTSEEKDTSQPPILNQIFGMTQVNTLTGQDENLVNLVRYNNGFKSEPDNPLRTRPVEWSICGIGLTSSPELNRVQGYYKCNIDGTDGIYGGPSGVR